ncbi:MAG: hypothetical protein GEU71_00525 [Actinobacteria bacterium]|nr:hypothetical protein [Actinomycetota bacterium]
MIIDALDLDQGVSVLHIVPSARAPHQAIEAAALMMSRQPTSQGLLIASHDGRASASSPGGNSAIGVAILLDHQGYARIEAARSWSEVSPASSNHQGVADPQWYSRVELESALDGSLQEFCRQVVAETGTNVDDIELFSLGNASPTACLKAGRALSLLRDQVYLESHTELLQAGTVTPLLRLIGLLEKGTEGGHLLLTTVGDGVSAVAIIMEAPFPGPRLAQQLEASSLSGAPTRSSRPSSAARSSSDFNALQYWRDSKAILRRTSGECAQCHKRSYPPSTLCVRCGSEEIIHKRSGDAGTVYTFTQDHIEDGTYDDTGTARCVIDLEDGTRMFTSVVNDGVAYVGAKVRLVLRKASRNTSETPYVWKSEILSSSESPTIQEQEKHSRER